jgi:vesicle-fusing ATPase
VAAYDDIESIQIARADFMHALDEVTPAFGVSEEELQQVVQNGIIHYAQQVNVSHRRRHKLIPGHSQRR